MPYDRPEPTDPNELIGVCVPADDSDLIEMAYTFAEEFAGLGHDEDRILRMFRNPVFAGPNAALAGLGESAVIDIVSECARAFGRMRVVVHDSRPQESRGRRRSRRED
jgi:hypothetical protein